MAGSPVSPWMIAAETLQLLNSGPALPAFLQKSAQRNTDPNFVYGVLHNAHQLNERGLPTGPYLLKANEGLAKGIGPAQIRPALEAARRQTELAESLVSEAQARGLVFSNPQQRQRAVQEYQWGLQGFSAPPAWGTHGGKYPPGQGPGHVKKPKHSKKMDPHGSNGHGWGQGKKGQGKK